MPKFRNEYKDIQEQLLAFFDELDNITLNKRIPKVLENKLDRNIKQWKKDNLLVGYFLYLVSINKYTYLDYIRLMIYSIYAYKQSNITKYSFDILSNVANDIFSQAKQESPVKPDYNALKSDLIWEWAFIYSAGISFKEYLALLTQTNAEEALKEFTSAITSQVGLSMDKMIQKQSNRILNINDNKYSGLLESVSTQVGNRVYYEPFPNQRVKFIAVEDNRTTDMCRSLDGQIFNTKDWNEFDRYSAADGTNVHYRIEGLQVGINLPPITNHFHWCRSTIQYLGIFENNAKDAI